MALPVLPKTIKVRVTREDLKHAYSGTNTCPIAQAIGRTYPDFTVQVGSTMVNLYRYQTGSPISTYVYKLRKQDDDKAHSRAQTLWGRIIGGFEVVLTEHTPWAPSAM